MAENSSGLFGRNLDPRKNLRTGLVLLAVAGAGVGLFFLASLLPLLRDAIPVGSLFLIVLPASSSIVMLTTTASLRLIEQSKTGATILLGVTAVLVYLVLGLAIYLPWSLEAIRQSIATGLSQDAIALTVTVGIIGLGFGFFINTEVPVRAYLAALIVPFAFSWPDYQGAYIVLTGGFDWLARSLASDTERLPDEAVAAIQASGEIALQFAAGAGAALLGAAVGHVTKAYIGSRKAH
jgi:hypothetical protein